MLATFRALAGGVDIDGDSVVDFVAGVLANDRGGAAAGAVFVVSGGVGGTSAVDDVASAVMIGADPGDYLGTAAAMLDDADGDGTGEVVAGAYANDDGGTDAGAVYLWDGPSGTVLASSADVVLLGESAGDAAYAVGTGGDVDGDGTDDLVVGAPFADGAGAARGAVYVVFGPPSSSGDLSLADGKYLGNADADYAGYEVAIVGDASGDGLADVAVTALGSDEGAADGGSVYLIDGPADSSSELNAAFASFHAEGADDSAGWSLGVGADLDGNGYADVLVGAPEADSAAVDAGAAYVLLAPFSGHRGFASADARLLGIRAGDRAGESCALAPDVTGDGCDDALIGGMNHDSSGSEDGGAWLVLGLGL